MAPEYEQKPLDPAFAQLMQTSQEQDIEAIRTKLQGDNGSLLARYGANLAVAHGAASTPLAGSDNPFLRKVA